MIREEFVLANYVDIKNVVTSRPACNGSLFIKDGKHFLIARETNYSFIFENELIKPVGTNNTYSNQNLFEIDKNTCNAKFIKCISSPTVEERTWAYSGNEDVRIINDTALRMSYTKTNNTHTFCINTAVLDENFNIVNEHAIMTQQKIEKNWQPIEGIAAEYVYSYKPFRLINVLTSKFIEKDNTFDDFYRGSSPIIRYKNYMIGIIHKSVNTPSERRYYHYFVMFDNNMNLMKISKPFLFIGANIEFNVSLLNENNDLSIIFSIYDNLCYYCKVDEKLLTAIFENKLNNADYSFADVHKKFYFDSLKNGNIRNAICMSTFTNDPNIMSAAVTLNYNYDFGHIGNKKRIQHLLITKCKKIMPQTP